MRSDTAKVLALAVCPPAGLFLLFIYQCGENNGRSEYVVYSQAYVITCNDGLCVCDE